MARIYLAGVETGGTKILACLRDLDRGETIAEGKWATSSADRAADDLISFFTSQMAGDNRIAAVGLAAFGPLIVDPDSADYGQMQATTKPGWEGSNLRRAIEDRLDVPVVVDTDVGCAAIAEQKLGAGAGLPSIAYVTVGTGIGAGLACRGRSLVGALHPEAGHLRLVRRADDHVPSACPFHSDCAEGLVSGPAVRGRLADAEELAQDPQLIKLVAEYLGQLAAALVLAWSPNRIVWGGGVIGATPMMEAIEGAMRTSLGGYGVSPAVDRPDFCVPAKFKNAGLEGALLMAREMALRRSAK